MSSIATTRPGLVVGAEELAGWIEKGPAPVILDIRFNLATPDGRPAYRDGHLPGAVYVDLPTELAGEPEGFSGRRPLPAIRDLQRDARRWGIGQGQGVVVYDDNFGLQASRAWWVLRWAGIADVRLLDGGLAAWKRSGLPIDTLVPLPSPGDVTLSAGHLPVLDADQAADLARSGVLLDARDRRAYEGEPAVEGQAPSGHIPGAVSAPTAENLDAQGRLRPDDELRRRFEGVGAAAGAPVGVYCGGGVTATHQILSLTKAGIPAALFPGSWSAWSADPSRPVATGPERG